MSLLSFHDQKHIARMLVQEYRVNGIYNRLISDLSLILERWKEGGRSVWVRNREIERLVDKRLREFVEEFKRHIDEETLKAWNLSNLKNDKLIEKFIKNLSISDVLKDGMMQRNMDAYEAFKSRTIGEMNLSDRIWSLSVQTKKNIEFFLESGIATGRNAEKISRDLRQMLNNPDKVFRRIRDKNGKLIPSKPMKNYNPGRGVYRSSRMNALRLAATETNMSYRLADYERWLRLDFVVGYEVRRSLNHEPCVICDALVGKYPKTFKFGGFHPFCICYAAPILLSQEDFLDYLVSDVMPEDKLIKDIPAVAREFLETNNNYRESSYMGKWYDEFLGL